MEQHLLEEFEVIYRPWITLRNGKRLYASSYGLKAFALKIRKKVKES